MINLFTSPTEWSKTTRSFTVWLIREKEKAAVTLYSFKKEYEYGIVQYYFLIRNTGIAVICKFEKKGNICSFDLEEQNDQIIESFLKGADSWNAFQAVKETSSHFYFLF